MVPPPVNQTYGKDICTLHILGDIPQGASRAIISIEPIKEFPKEFRALGFPQDWNETDTARGYVVSRQRNAAYMLRPFDPFTAALTAAVFGFLLRRHAGLIHKGFSGGPVEVDGKPMETVSRSRKKPMDVTAYATPFLRERPQRPPRSSTIEPRTWCAAAGDDIRYRSTYESRRGMAQRKYRSIL